MNRDAEDRFYRPTADRVEPPQPETEASIRPPKPTLVSSPPESGR